MLTRITSISWAIRALASLGEHEVVLSDYERASLAKRWHDIVRLRWHRCLRLLLLMELYYATTLPFFLVVLKLPMLSMFLKFEIQCSLTRGWSRIILTDQTSLFGEGKLLGGLRAWRTTWALVRLHCINRLIWWALMHFCVEDFLEVRLLIQCLSDLVEWLHTGLRWLFHHLTLVATSIVINFALWTRLIRNVLNNLVSTVA